jgi:hypothetical protein
MEDVTNSVEAGAPSEGVPAPLAVEPKVKRKYVKISPEEFIKIANDSEGLQAIAEKTGMSYCGVRFRVLKIREAAKKRKEKCPIKPLADGRLKK